MGEQSLLTVLVVKMTESTPLISMMKASPNLMKPPTPKFKLEKYSYVSIMWWVACCGTSHRSC
jgi:hypothetical protein